MRNEQTQPAQAGQVEQTVRPLVEKLRESADEVMEFPHPSYCDHLHSAHAVMREAADEIERLRFAVGSAEHLLRDHWPPGSTDPDVVAWLNEYSA